jgi:hypothetical protein
MTHGRGGIEGGGWGIMRVSEALWRILNSHFKYIFVICVSLIMAPVRQFICGEEKIQQYLRPKMLQCL